MENLKAANRRNAHVKYILVCGASASAIGKGISVSSIAALMKAAGYVVTMTKIDPYLVHHSFWPVSLSFDRTSMLVPCHLLNMVKSSSWTMGKILIKG